MNDTFLWLSATGWIAIFTVVLAVIAYFQMRVYAAIHGTTKTTERAYVDISHDPPGLTITTEAITYTVAVKNHGRTPASVGAAVMFLELREAGAPLPDNPPYGTPLPTLVSAFLMPGEAFHQWIGQASFPKTSCR